jgi:ligand-binding sensor domain-containing protein
MMVRALLFWLLLLCCAQVRAQQPYSYSITTEQGLPSREVYRIVQDKDGFIWIGCNAGLFRYDGEVFKPYRNVKQTGRAMSNLKFDPQGRLWCGSFTGQLFFVENDSLQLFTDWSEHEKQFPQYCFGVDGQVWVTSDSGLYVLSAQGAVLQAALFPSDARHAYRGVESVECLPNGDIIAYSQTQRAVHCAQW